MSYKVSNLKNPNNVRESWLEIPMLNFLRDKLKRKENKNLIKVGQGTTGTGKSFFIRNKFCPEIFKEKDFILYLAPQTENIPVDEFDALVLNINTCLQEIQILLLENLIKVKKLFWVNH